MSSLEIGGLDITINVGDMGSIVSFSVTDGEDMEGLGIVDITVSGVVAQELALGAFLSDVIVDETTGQISLQKSIEIVVKDMSTGGYTSTFTINFVFMETDVETFIEEQ